MGRREGDGESVPSQPADVLTLALCIVGMGALIWWSNGWPVLIGVGLTGICAMAVRLSPVLPVSREGLAVAGLCARNDCLCSDLVKLAWLRTRQGDYFGSSKCTVNVTIDEKVQRNLSLVGRLGDSYVLWEPVQKAAVLVPVDNVSRLEIAQKFVLPAKSVQSR